MINLDQLYSIKQKIPKFIRRIFPKFDIFRYYFLKTNLNNLPKKNYPEEGNLEYQISLIEKFKILKRQSSSMTCPHLIQLLLLKYSPDQNFSFLDIGGEKIDFYLILKKKFKNIKYYLFNQKQMLKPFYEIKEIYNYKDLNLVDNYEELLATSYDFVNLGSCIQYFDDYETFLKKIQKNSKYIFFSATHLYDSSDKNYDKDIIVKQVNVLPQENYLYFFNRKKFFELFEEKNFELVFENENLTDNVNYNNFKSYLDNIQYSDFLFLKKE